MGFLRRAARDMHLPVVPESAARQWRASDMFRVERARLHGVRPRNGPRDGRRVVTAKLPVSTGLVGLDPVWQRCRERIAHLGRVGGTVTLHGLDALTRDALADLLGSRVPLTDEDRVPLARIDAALTRSRHATGLLTVVEAMCGPVPDRPGERAARRLTWEAGLARAHAHR
ncbi:MAG: hypothetical protein DYH08_16130, partial [Actinobacteria bacterium ATB1]|nr:hypothetical protein [Actinobacteria bacterium ATB1]